jgi:hypothetical protein
MVSSSVERSAGMWTALTSPHSYRYTVDRVGLDADHADGGRPRPGSAGLPVGLRRIGSCAVGEAARPNVATMARAVRPACIRSAALRWTPARRRLIVDFLIVRGTGRAKMPHCDHAANAAHVALRPTTLGTSFLGTWSLQGVDFDGLDGANVRGVSPLWVRQEELRVRSCAARARRNVRAVPPAHRSSVPPARV